MRSSLYISYDAEVRRPRGSLCIRNLCKHSNSGEQHPRRAQVDAPSNWIKLADFPGCVDQRKVATFDGTAPDKYNEWNITLPAWLPTSEHAVLRWEWTSVQQVANIEFYVTCADVEVMGTAEVPDSSFLAKVTPVTAFTGTSHLPADAGAYRKVTATLEPNPNLGAVVPTDLLTPRVRPY